MAKIEGGCLCGHMRYASDAEPVLIANCYCDNCRRLTGSTHSYNLGMPAGSVTVMGDTLRTYVDTTGSTGAPFNRHFCGNCGTHFRSEGEAYPGLEFIKAGTLDNAEAYPPGLHIWCEQRLGWVPMPEGATEVARNP